MRAQENFRLRQATENPSRDAVQSYCNLLDCILDLYYENYDFVRHTRPEESPYLNTTLFRYLLQYVGKMVQDESGSLSPRYSLEKWAGFILYGLWGFVNASSDDPAQTRAEARELLKNILTSDALAVPTP